MTPSTAVLDTKICNMAQILTASRINEGVKKTSVWFIPHTKDLPY